MIWSVGNVRELTFFLTGAAPIDGARASAIDRAAVERALRRGSEGAANGEFVDSHRPVEVAGLSPVDGLANDSLSVCATRSDGSA